MGKHAGPLMALTLGALASGCVLTLPTEMENSELERMIAAGDWSAIAAIPVLCITQTDACAARHATRADACLRLVIQQPGSASAQDARIRELLDCAETEYRSALERQPSSSSTSRISFHGGLLLTLSERRNRLMDGTDRQQLAAANELLLSAAAAARRDAPDSAMGFLYGASAHVYRAALEAEQTRRCADLYQARTLLQRSPAPPTELQQEQQRIQALVRRQLQDNGCRSRPGTR
ncbi:hypothetical protein F2Q65_13935 [Thiohalocapsa marina]|uniref:Uncharacterized protein n=1 Tax=Thiohalocapsa marina TaxID=424902 RepID=A0A5M8FGQ6_9GAMM|nr:hypothetical protein [Thiohalocapsa marina]KAA6184048.1 hypothetical protein F2Q65_13935 [Thiohalocapsa marina]